MSEPFQSKFPLGTVLNRLGEALVPQQRYNRNAQGPWSRQSLAGTVIDEDNVLEIDTIMAIVRVLAESIASLPLELFNIEADGNETLAVDHPVYDLLRWTPNPETTSYELRFIMMVDAILRGYGAAQVRRTVKGRPMELWQLDARFLYARRAPDDGRLIYLYKYYNKGRVVKEIMLEADEVLIVKPFSSGGLLGTSINRKMFNVIGGARAIEDYTNEYFMNGSAISGTITVPEELSEVAYTRLKKDWVETHTGTGNRFKAPILEGGGEFTPFKLNAAESQILESQKYKRSTLAGVWRVPAHLINDLEKATFSNIESVDLAFAKHSLRPWTINWEQRCQLTLLNSGERKRMRVVHDYNDMTKGEFGPRMEAYSAAVQAGIISPNEVRRREHMNSYKDGDKYYVQGALRPTDQPYQSAAGKTGSESKKTKVKARLEKLEKHPLLQ